MAVAVVGTPAETAVSTASTSHVVNLPTGTAGNMFVAVMSKGSAGTTPSVNSLTGWNELLDEAIVLGLYIAVKECDGTEGATTTFTLSSATRGAWIVYEVSGQVAFATQSPQVGTTATGSSTSPDPPSVSVTGGTKNVLTIACFGRNLENADDDAWVSSAPSGFGGLLQKTCGVAGSNLGGLVATAHLNQQTATADPGVFTAVTGAWRAQTIVIHPAVVTGAATQALTFTSTTSGTVTELPRTTGVARISLASGDTPDTQTDHSITVKARTTTGSTGKINVALYEGANNRSGNLVQTGSLTNSLVAYTIDIGDTEAATITDYSDLEIRLWGTNATGGLLTYEVAEVSLTIPVGASGPTEYFGAATQSLTFTSTTVGKVDAKGATTQGLTFTSTTQGAKTTATTATQDLTFTSTTQGFATKSGAATQDLVFNATTQGTVEGGVEEQFGAATQDLVFTSTTVGKVTAFSSSTQALVLDSTTQGYATKSAATTQDLVFTATTQGAKSTSGATTQDLTLGITTQGVRVVFGATTQGLTFNATTLGLLEALGSVVLPLTFTSTTSGTKTTSGAVVLPLTFNSTTQGTSSGSAGGVVILPLTFTATTVGKVTAKGAATQSLTATFTTQGIRTTSGAATQALVFNSTSSGYREKFGAVVLPLTFTSTSAGIPTRIGQSALTLSYGSTTVGLVTAQGSVVLPLSVALTSVGSASVWGTAQSLALLLDIVTNGTREGSTLVMLPEVSAGRIAYAQSGDPSARGRIRVVSDERGVIAR